MNSKVKYNEMNNKVMIKLSFSGRPEEGHNETITLPGGQRATL